jgi:hypothetical protein
VIEKDKTYLINHAVRGVFVLRVTSVSKSRIRGEILAGNVRWAFGIKSAGDQISLGLSECHTAIEQPEENKALAKSRLNENIFREH